MNVAAACRPVLLIGCTPHKLHELVQPARVYEFLAWRKAHVLAEHRLVHNRCRCPRHGIPLQRVYPGKTHRRSFFCLRRQKLYTED